VSGRTRRVRIRAAAALYELALRVAPKQVAEDVQEIVADGLDIGRARLELAELPEVAR
jgi:hypothetical protein